MVKVVKEATVMTNGRMKKIQLASLEIIRCDIHEWLANQKVSNKLMVEIMNMMRKICTKDINQYNKDIYDDC